MNSAGKPTAKSTNPQRQNSIQLTKKDPELHIEYRLNKRCVISKWRVDAEFKGYTKDINMRCISVPECF